MSPETLDRFLSGDNGILPLPAEAMNRLLDTHPLPDHLVLPVRLGDSASKAAALDELARALDMPRWFGHNWDALEDCLTDLDWLPAQPILLVVEGHLATPEEADTLVSILQSACDSWADAARDFHVLLDSRLMPPD